MAIELKIPEVGESITEVEIGEWLKKPGETVRKDETVVTLESEKATVELPAPESGTLTQVLKRKGEVAKVGEVIAYLEKDGSKAPAGKTQASEARPERATTPKATEPRVMPAAERALAERGLKPAEVEATGPGGRLLKEDVERHVERPKPAPARQSVPAEVASSLPRTADGRQEEVVPM